MSSLVFKIYLKYNYWMLAYRLEHPESGKGPWWHQGPTWDDDAYAKFDKNWMDQSDTTIYNEPRRDGIKEFCEGTDIVAVPDIDMLKEWFGFQDIITMLEHAGFKIRVYDIPDDSVKWGGAQIAFDSLLACDPVKEYSPIILKN